MENNFAIEVMAKLIYWTGNQHLGTKKKNLRKRRF